MCVYVCVCVCVCVYVCVCCVCVRNESYLLTGAAAATASRVAKAQRTSRDGIVSASGLPANFRFVLHACPANLNLLNKLGIRILGQIRVTETQRERPSSVLVVRWDESPV